MTHAALLVPTLQLDPATAAGWLGLALAVPIGAGILLAILRGFLYICRPNQILIFSGRRHALPDGTMVGFKILKGGWGFRVPLLENVSQMDMRLFMVDVSVANAYSKGGIPLAVQAIANVKVASDHTLLRNAVERFLGTDPRQIAIVARQTLEGVLREVLAQLTPEEVNEDRLKFAETLRANAKDDFDKLGLELDVLKVQHVADEQSYLQNLGRARIATMIRDAQNAENEANQKIAEEEAAARRRAESAQKKAEGFVLQKRNVLRTELAKMQAQVKSTENEATIAAETARSLAEQELQGKRSELEQLRLQADVVLPAEAERLAQTARARGSAAPTVENGKAAAEALALVSAEWQAAGADGRDVYVLSQLRPLVESAVERVAGTKVGEMTIVDGGDGRALGAFVACFPAAVGRVMEETGKTVGLDVPAILSGAPRKESR
ncbi:flotillin family protein [Acidobacteria bacterium ACD]|nr:MAG: flotillin family protein [Acidobacteriota bacterium]MDL1949254.1 flotillin family protein [Acidobacteria bacterium ACD]